MEDREYFVERIDGDYAWVRPADGAGEAMPVARALLPEETDEGCRLMYRMLSWELL